MARDRNRLLNPQGRQKSCLECAKSKRRCDLRQPSCVRCSRQKLTCLYPPRPHTTNATVHESPLLSPVFNTDYQNDVPGPYIFDFDIPGVTSIESELIDFDLQPNTPSLDSCNAPDPNHGGLILHIPSPRSTSLSASTNMSPMFNTVTLSPLAKSRIGFPYKQMKDAPRMMVEKNATHWCHPKLYEEYMPHPLQDAYASCALYIARNETNATFIARHIMEHAQLLIEKPSPTPPIEILARTQAFVLYIIILVCADDIRYFGQVENLLPHIEQSQAALFAILSHDEDLVESIPLYPGSAARSAWQSFIFRESCRRTLLITFQIMAMHNLFRGRLGSCAHELAVGNRLVVSSSLWDASSPFEFATAWNNKQYFLVKNLEFDEVLSKANAKDIDVFARMMMVGILGVDDVRGWIHMRGGQL